jgi:hypothetical protein
MLGIKHILCCVSFFTFIPYQKTVSLGKMDNLLAMEAVLLYPELNANLLMEIATEKFLNHRP